MNIGLVGGLARHEAELGRRAAARGHCLEFHDGDVGGTGAVELERIVDRCDLIVIVTAVNSHGAVGVAKKALRRRHRVGSLFLRTCGIARFELLLDALDRREAMVAAVGDPAAGTRAASPLTHQNFA
jgi:hypothetical protein